MSLVTMNNKVYYGEYSLKHWINLILKGNIKLPELQKILCLESRKNE